MGNVAGGVGEDEVVDVCVFKGGVFILEETVAKEYDAKSYSGRENDWSGEEGRGHC